MIAMQIYPVNSIIKFFIFFFAVLSAENFRGNTAAFNCFSHQIPRWALYVCMYGRIHVLNFTSYRRSSCQPFDAFPFIFELKLKKTSKVNMNLLCRIFCPPLIRIVSAITFSQRPRDPETHINSPIVHRQNIQIKLLDKSSVRVFCGHRTANKLPWPGLFYFSLSVADFVRIRTSDKNKNTISPHKRK